MLSVWKKEKKKIKSSARFTKSAHAIQFYLITSGVLKRKKK